MTSLLSKTVSLKPPGTKRPGQVNIVSQIWTKDGKISEAQAHATFNYLQPTGPQPVNFPTTFTNEFLPK
jgi:hypothetical protein